MKDLRLSLAQARYAVLGFTRNPSALVFTVLMPILLLLLFASIFKGHTLFTGLRVPVAAYYTAAIVAYEVMLTGFSSMVITVTTEREAGRLKRFRGTPMPGWVYLVAQIARTVLIVVVVVLALVAVGALCYHVHIPGHTVVGLVVYVVLGTAAFCAMGLALTRACTTTESASAIGPFATVILSFLSGVFIPVAILPRWLLDLGKVFPLEHLARGLQRAFLVPGSTGLTAVNVGVLAAWGIVALFLAARTFEWEALATGGT